MANLKRTLEVGTAGETHETWLRRSRQPGLYQRHRRPLVAIPRSMLNLCDSDKVVLRLIYTTGNTSVSDVALARTAVAADRAHLMIQPTIFAFEFFINAWVPEWGGALRLVLRRMQSSQTVSTIRRQKKKFSSYVNAVGREPRSEHEQGHDCYFKYYVLVGCL